MDYGREIPAANRSFVAMTCGELAISAPHLPLRLIDWQPSEQVGLFALGDWCHVFGAKTTFWAEYIVTPEFLATGPQVFENRWRELTEEEADSTAPTLRELLRAVAELDPS